MICPGCGCVFCDDYADYPPGAAFRPKRYCSGSCRRAAKPEGLRRAIRLRICASREKIPYQTLEEARDAAGWMLLRKGIVTYPYECPCGNWHLSKQLPGTWEETG